MRLNEINRLAKIAADAGLEIHRHDYDWSVGAWNPTKKVGVRISQVFRRERDGYSGSKLIEEDVLRDWIKENPV